MYATASHVFLASRIENTGRMASIAGTGAPLVDLGPLKFFGLDYVGEARSVGDELWFVAEAPGGEGDELWISDGSVVGTRLLTDLQLGPEDGDVEFIAVGAGGAVFFGQRADPVVP